MVLTFQQFSLNNDYSLIKLGEANQGKVTKKQFSKFSDLVKKALQNEDCIGTLTLKNNKEIHGIIFGDSISQQKVSEVCQSMASDEDDPFQVKTKVGSRTANEVADEWEKADVYIL